MLERLAQEPEAEFILAKVNVDENPNLSIRFGIRGIPAVKAFFHGEVVAEFVGVKPEPMLRQFLNDVLPSDEDYMLNEGLSLLATHHWKQAADAFRDVLDIYPGDASAALGLASALLAQGQGSEAADYLALVKDGSELVRAEALRPLAAFLTQYEEEWSRNDEEREPIEMQYFNAARLLRRGNLEACMDALLEVLRQDKRYRKGEPRRVLLAIFALLGDDDALTFEYRRELATVLY
jgi:putative thioredoxin